MSDVAVKSHELLAEADWLLRAETHHRRADAFLAPHLRRTRTGEAHPVWDFLFTYYSLRPRQLRVWHAGYGAVLAGDRARSYLTRTGYGPDRDGVTVTDDYLRTRVETGRFVERLLRATAARPPQLNCFGLHEWAMVYRSTEVRHDGVPLRLGAAGTDAVVDAAPLRCSHFDAFRFFTPAAAQRNARTPTRQSQPATEQPGCVHANMDLYKWCYKLGPLADSELLLDCLELAAAARELDMRASPYDLRTYGFDPIRIEEPAGRAEYVRCQSVIAQRAAPLRDALIARCDLVLAACG
ncbi:MAG: hypothetical protein JWR37_1028 [Mycobacterium sp.]|nr:hypothetical protein [Mycobacterium sp.]